MTRKETVRRLVDDLADLPVRQRAALLARELDDQTPEQVAAQLGVSVMAAHKLASRARESLIKARDARDADCVGVRTALLDSHERGVRPSDHGLRHVRGCDACRAYQRDVRRLDRQLHALNPALGLPVLAGIVQLIGGGAGKAAAGVAAATLLAVTGGVVVLSSDTHSPGDPAPFTMLSIRDSQGRPVSKGAPIPEGLTVVTARVRFPAGPDTRDRPRGEPLPALTLSCPPGMKFAGLGTPPEDPVLTTVANPVGAIMGYSRSVRWEIHRAASPRPYKYTIAMNCRRPDRYGSISTVHNATFRGLLQRDPRRLRHLCPKGADAVIRPAPSRGIADRLPRGQPVVAGRRALSGRWTRVITDGRYPLIGWAKTRDLCR